jgi:hypothetical protein
MANNEEAPPTGSSKGADTLKEYVQTGLGLASILYLGGFLVNTIYLASLGVYDFDVLRVRYILVGGLFAWFCLSTFYPIVWVSSKLSKSPSGNGITLAALSKYYGLASIVSQPATLAVAIALSAVAEMSTPSKSLGPLSALEVMLVPLRESVGVVAFVVYPTVFLSVLYLLGKGASDAITRTWQMIQAARKAAPATRTSLWHKVRNVPRTLVSAEWRRQFLDNLAALFLVLALVVVALYCARHVAFILDFPQFLAPLGGGPILEGLPIPRWSEADPWLRFWGASFCMYVIISLTFVAFAIMAGWRVLGTPGKNMPWLSFRGLEVPAAFGIILIIFASLLLPFYATRIFPFVPRHLGGGEPIHVAFAETINGKPFPLRDRDILCLMDRNSSTLLLDVRRYDGLGGIFRQQILEVPAGQSGPITYVQSGRSSPCVGLPRRADAEHEPHLDEALDHRGDSIATDDPSSQIDESFAPAQDLSGLPAQE